MSRQTHRYTMSEPTQSFGDPIAQVDLSIIVTHDLAQRLVRDLFEESDADAAVERFLDQLPQDEGYRRVLEVRLET